MSHITDPHGGGVQSAHTCVEPSSAPPASGPERPTPLEHSGLPYLCPQEAAAWSAMGALWRESGCPDELDLPPGALAQRAGLLHKRGYTRAIRGLIRKGVLARDGRWLKVNKSMLRNA